MHTAVRTASVPHPAPPLPLTHTYSRMQSFYDDEFEAKSKRTLVDSCGSGGGQYRSSNNNTNMCFHCRHTFGEMRYTQYWYIWTMELDVYLVSSYWAHEYSFSTSVVYDWKEFMVNSIHPVGEWSLKFGMWSRDYSRYWHVCVYAAVIAASILDFRAALAIGIYK